MSKLIAIHFLHLAGALAGTVDLVEPGQAFIAREEELYLADNGAARAATAEDKGATLATRSVAAAPALTKETAAPVEDLGKMTKAELIALAAAEEIAIDQSANTNKLIIKAIEDGRVAKAADEDDGI